MDNAWADSSSRDTPLNLVFEYGAFLNGSIVEDFDFYARTCFERFGDRVKLWFTFKYDFVRSLTRVLITFLSEPRVYGSQYQGRLSSFDPSYF